MRASDAFRPADSRHELSTDIEVGKDRTASRSVFGKGFVFHAPILPDRACGVKYIITLKVLPMSSDTCYPCLRSVHSQREREYLKSIVPTRRKRLDESLW